MRFALGSMTEYRVHVQKTDMLRVYEARIGLEQWVTPLLDGQLSGEDAMRLMKSDRDQGLFAILPAPQPADKAYVAFLARQAGAATWPLHCRQKAFELLFALDEWTYRKSYQEFLLKNAKTANDWWERAGLYCGLIQLHDAESMSVVRDALTHDPITECREGILYFLQKRGDATSVIDAILTVANGQDVKHHAVTPSRMAGQWSYELNEYLKWAKTQKGLDANTLQRIDDSIERLRDKDWD